MTRFGQGIVQKAILSCSKTLDVSTVLRLFDKRLTEELPPMAGAQGNARQLCRIRFDVGERVKLHRLQTKTQLNGSVGTIDSEIINGRYAIKLDGRRNKRVKVKPDNVVALSPPADDSSSVEVTPGWQQHDDSASNGSVPPLCSGQRAGDSSSRSDNSVPDLCIRGHSSDDSDRSLDVGDRVPALIERGWRDTGSDVSSDSEMSGLRRHIVTRQQTNAGDIIPGLVDRDDLDSSDDERGVPDLETRGRSRQHQGSSDDSSRGSTREAPTRASLQQDDQSRIRRQQHQTSNKKKKKKKGKKKR
jgi:hypothetical protein